MWTQVSQPWVQRLRAGNRSASGPGFKTREFWSTEHLLKHSSCSGDLGLLADVARQQLSISFEFGGSKQLLSHPIGRASLRITQPVCTFRKQRVFCGLKRIFASPRRKDHNTLKKNVTEEFLSMRKIYKQADRILVKNPKRNTRISMMFLHTYCQI